MTNVLLRAFLDLPRERKVNCLEVPDEGQPIMWKIVNLHEDLVGIHLIIEKVG